MPRYIPLQTLQPVSRRDFFVEGVATRYVLIYRLLHRPTGMVVETSFPQRARNIPPFQVIVEMLLCEMMGAIYDPPVDGPPEEEGPFYAA